MPGLIVMIGWMLLNALTLACMTAAHALHGPALLMLVGSNVLLIVGVCVRWPRYYLGLVTGVIRYGFYRFRVQGQAHLPSQGAAILVCNHVSYMDVPLLMAASTRPLVFWVHQRMFEQRALGDFLRASGAIAVATKQQDPQHYEAALQAAVSALQNGQLLVIFPEGRLTRGGQLQAFKSGVLKIAQIARAQGLQPPVIPMALSGLWGSYFSWIDPCGPMQRMRWSARRRRVVLRIGLPIPCDAVELEALRSAVAQLHSESML